MRYLMYLDTSLDVEKIDEIFKIGCCGQNGCYSATHQHGTMLGQKHEYSHNYPIQSIGLQLGWLIGVIMDQY